MCILTESVFEGTTCALNYHAKKNKVGCYQKVDGCSQPQIFGDDHVENHQTLKRQT